MRFIQRVAVISGAVFVLVSVLGLVAGGMPGMKMGGASVLLLGLFPVNMLHNLVHGAFGVWGLMAGRADPIAPAEQAERLADVLRQAGADVTLHWTSGGHGITKGEVDAAREWISQCLTAHCDRTESHPA